RESRSLSTSSPLSRCGGTASWPGAATAAAGPATAQPRQPMRRAGTRPGGGGSFGPEPRGGGGGGGGGRLGRRGERESRRGLPAASHHKERGPGQDTNPKGERGDEKPDVGEERRGDARGGHRGTARGIGQARQQRRSHVADQGALIGPCAPGQHRE